MMTNRFFRTLFTLGMVIVLLSACAGPQAAPKTPLRVSWSLWPGYYPMAIAVEKGFFEKHGAQVEAVFYPVYANQAADLASGMIDGALITMNDTFFDTISEDIKIVLILDNSDGAEQIVARSEISTLKDLRGKRIGFASSSVNSKLLIRQMLNDNGIAISEVTLVDVSVDKIPDAIPSRIDVGYTYEPYTSAALSKGNKIIYTTANVPGLGVDVLAFRKDSVQNRTEDVKAFIAAWFEALQYWQDNPADANAIIAKATGLKPEEISLEGVKMFDLNANLKAFTQGTDYTSVYFAAQNELEFIISTGDITSPVNINDLLDPSFLK